MIPRSFAIEMINNLDTWTEIVIINISLYSGVGKTPKPLTDKDGTLFMAHCLNELINARNEAEKLEIAKRTYKAPIIAHVSFKAKNKEVLEYYMSNKIEIDTNVLESKSSLDEVKKNIKETESSKPTNLEGESKKKELLKVLKKHLELTKEKYEYWVKLVPVFVNDTTNFTCGFKVYK